VNRERRQLLEHLGRPTLGAGDRLIAGADELLEVRLALHARVLVDRHATSVLSAPVKRWTVPILEGRVVRLEPLRPEHRSVEVGWTWLHPSAWGTGANVEAKLLQLRHAFEAWGCRRVELKTDALNERSRGALEALGATFEGVHRKHMLVRGGESRDSAWYSVTDDEWLSVQALLESRLAEK
jgi:Acetyltransferase (GNAT) domain